MIEIGMMLASNRIKQKKLPLPIDDIFVHSIAAFLRYQEASVF